MITIAVLKVWKGVFTRLLWRIQTASSALILSLSAVLPSGKYLDSRRSLGGAAATCMGVLRTANRSPPRSVNAAGLQRIVLLRGLMHFRWASHLARFLPPACWRSTRQTVWHKGKPHAGKCSSPPAGFSQVWMHLLFGDAWQHCGQHQHCAQGRDEQSGGQGLMVGGGM